MFILISGIMGFLYGLISGIVIQPAFFSIIFTGVIVAINFVISIVVWIFRIVFYSLGEQSERVNKYLMYSLAFALVYFPFFVILKWIPYKPF